MKLNIIETKSINNKPVLKFFSEGGYEFCLSLEQAKDIKYGNDRFLNMFELELVEEHKEAVLHFVDNHTKKYTNKSLNKYQAGTSNFLNPKMQAQNKPTIVEVKVESGRHRMINRSYRKFSVKPKRNKRR